jgi:hypothetical protein
MVFSATAMLTVRISIRRKALFHYAELPREERSHQAEKLFPNGERQKGELCGRP